MSETGDPYFRTERTVALLAVFHIFGARKQISPQESKGSVDLKAKLLICVLYLKSFVMVTQRYLML